MHKHYTVEMRLWRMDSFIECWQSIIRRLGHKWRCCPVIFYRGGWSWHFSVTQVAKRMANFCSEFQLKKHGIYQLAIGLTVQFFKQTVSCFWIFSRRFSKFPTTRFWRTFKRILYTLEAFSPMFLTFSVVWMSDHFWCGMVPKSVCGRNVFSEKVMAFCINRTVEKRIQHLVTIKGEKHNLQGLHQHSNQEQKGKQCIKIDQADRPWKFVRIESTSISSWRNLS